MTLKQLLEKERLERDLEYYTDKLNHYSSPYDELYFSYLKGRDNAEEKLEEFKRII